MSNSGAGQSFSGSGIGRVAEPQQIPEDVFAPVSAKLQCLSEPYHGFDEEGTYFIVRVLGGE